LNSVVFRGIPNEHFEEIINTTRSWHDGEIILSTWDDVELDESLVDQVVRDEDPGPVLNIDQNPSLIHAHRQILAAYNGVTTSKGKKVLLTRADIIHRKDIFDFVVPRKNEKTFNKLFDHKIVCGNMMTFDSDTVYGEPRERYYRVSDWFQCGYREDVFKFVDVKYEIEKYKYSGCCLEQLWLISAINKHTDTVIKPLMIDEWLTTVNESWKTILTNFKIIDTRSTAAADNYRWLSQPEYYSCRRKPVYITESKYEKKRIEMGY